MTSLFRPRASFLQNTAWQNQALNALHYNVAQQGSVVPLVYGTVRQPVNLIDLGNYRGPQGKKGKVGSLPVSGTHQSGKGGGDSKGKGGKKDHSYTIYVDFAVCQGPISGNFSNAIYSSSGVETQSVSGLHFYDGHDGQAPDSYFSQVGYSGTCHITGTPLVLGQSPVVPNIGLEITGILTGVHTGGYGRDANPGDVIYDFLTNPRYGAGFPPECLAQLSHDDSGVVHNTFGDYCQAVHLLISMSLDGHQKAIEWLSGLVTLVNSALVWSGKVLKIVPYGDLALNSNGTTWSPDFAPKYNLTDRDFLLASPHQDGAVPSPGADDPIILTRSNPADADNWVSIEYNDRLNFYNSTILTAFDQGAIDTYGLRIGDSLPGRTFTNPASAQIALQLILQRRLYVRNTSIKFQVGWQFALLEPMDMVSLTGQYGDNYLNQYPVRIVSIEENDNGDLTVVSEDPVAGTALPAQSPNPMSAVHWNYSGPVMRWGWDLPYDPIYDWTIGIGRPPDSSVGTFSVWVHFDESTRPRAPGEALPPGYSGTSSGDSYGLIRTTRTPLHLGTPTPMLAIAIRYDLSVFVYLGGVIHYLSPPGVITVGPWHHIMVSWNSGEFNPVKCWVDGGLVGNSLGGTIGPSTIAYSFDANLSYYTAANSLAELTTNFAGCTNYFWFDATAQLSDPGAFRTLSGTPRDLGPRGAAPLGGPPKVYFYWDGIGSPSYNLTTMIPGMKSYNINRAGYRCDDGAYWLTQNSSPSADFYCDPYHPNSVVSGQHPTPCNMMTW